MSHNGKRYTEEFKRQIIDLYLAGKPIAQLTEEYGLIEQAIYKWKKLYAPSIEVDENQSVSLKDYKELQKKVQKLEMENEILKKLQPYSPENNRCNCILHNEISTEAYNSIFEYIESWYNRRRTHSSLGYKTPDAVHAEGAA